LQISGPPDQPEPLWYDRNSIIMKKEGGKAHGG
jgi:hypothetical protein